MKDSSLTLYQTGAAAFKEARYSEAIASLEQFCKETTKRQSKQFFQAQMWLIQAYYRDDRDLHAIALCEQLAKSEIPQVQRWATNALNKLMSTAEAVPNSAPVTPAFGTAPPLSAAARNPFDEITAPPSTIHNAAAAIDQATSAGDSRVLYDGASIPQQSTRPSTQATSLRSQQRKTAKKSQQKDFNWAVRSSPGI
jgi:hypothetical protein